MAQEEQVKDVSTNITNNNADQEVADQEVTSKNTTFSSVSIASTQKKFLLIFFILLGALLAYYFIFEGNDSKDKAKSEPVDKKEKEQILKTSKPVPEVNKDPEIKDLNKDPKSIEAPQVQAPTPPPPPPPPPEKKSVPQKPTLPLPPSLNTSSGDDDDDDNSSSKTIFRSPFSDDSEEQKKKQMAIESKMRQGIMVSGGGSGGGLLGGDNDKNKNNKSSSKKSTSDFLGFGDGTLDGEVIGKTTADTVKATEVTNLNRTIIQGKIIYAVLETAINTDIPGMLRAIVSRDIYAEQGTDIMIPKGSRLIGTYTSQVKGGQTRVGVIWNRLIRPDGLDIEIKSQGVDQLGRPGVAGNVYDHFWRKIGNAFLVSYVVPVAAAEAAKKASNIKNSSSSSSSTTGNDGSITITTTGDPVSQAITDSTKQFSDITKSMIQDSFSTNPTITVNQGTIINILVQKDLVFPPPSLLQNRKLNSK